jgi:hypothetical protein
LVHFCRADVHSCDALVPTHGALVHFCRADVHSCDAAVQLKALIYQQTGEKINICSILIINKLSREDFRKVVDKYETDKHNKGK